MLIDTNCDCMATKTLTLCREIKETHSPRPIVTCLHKRLVFSCNKYSCQDLMGIWYIVLASCLGQNHFCKNRLMTTITWKVFYDKLTANFSQTVTTLRTASVSSRAPQNNSSVKHKSEASSGNFKHTCFSSCFWLRSLHRWLQSKKKRYMVLQKILSHVKNTKDKDIIDKIKKYYY